MLVVAIVDESVEALHRFDPDIATAATVATVGSAEFNEFLAPERDGAAAAITRTDVDFAFVEKPHVSLVADSVEKIEGAVRGGA
jgi:hypothetical protein